MANKTTKPTKRSSTKRVVKMDRARSIMLATHDEDGYRLEGLTRKGIVKTISTKAKLSLGGAQNYYQRLYTSMDYMNPAS